MKKKILLVDDTDAFLYILTHILKHDYTLAVSKSGEDGIEIAKEEKPDLILMDIMMPGMSGYEALAALKADADTRHIPVILSSGKTSDEEVASGLALGAADYIKKPFVVTEVKEKVAAQFA